MIKYCDMCFTTFNEMGTISIRDDLYGFDYVTIFTCLNCKSYIPKEKFPETVEKKDVIGYNVSIC